MRYNILIIVFNLLISYNLNSEHTDDKKQNQNNNIIYFEKSDYGIIFTNILVNGENVKAMIDFGDPNVLQLSSSLVKKQNLTVHKSNAIAKDVFGNSFSINTGLVNEILIGNWKEKNVKFSSSPNEMESVSKQINTTFKAVIGWGYFSKYYIQMDYKENKFLLSKDELSNNNYFLKTTFNKNSNYLNIPTFINDLNANFIIDTGSPVSLIDSSFMKQKDLKDVNIKLGNKKIDLDLHIQNLEILKQIGANGIIGGDFLTNYKVTIDPFKNELTLKKNVPE